MPIFLRLVLEKKMHNVIQIRRGTGTSLEKFREKKQGRIAFIGGSITRMTQGYSFLTTQLLREMFPFAELEFINAGISSTCSNTGAFRIGQDVLSKGKIDLLFIEFAVNDNQDGHLKPASTVRAMEGMVRQAFKNNPQVDIVFLYTANESHNRTYAQGKVPREIRAMEKVAKYYRIPTISFAQHVAECLAAGDFDWTKDFGEEHPSLFGNKIYCSLIQKLLERSKKANPAVIPAELFDRESLVNGKFISPSAAEFDDKWTLGIPDWEALSGIKRDCFTNVTTLFSTTPGAELTLSFSGNCIGFYLTAGPDAGCVSYSIDGSPFKKTDLFHHYSAGLHYPYTKMLAENLEFGDHKLVLRVSKLRNPKSIGNAVRIMKFATNESEKS